MLQTQQPVLQRFWYPVMYSRELVEQPRAIRFFGQDVVLWRAEEGRPAAVIDRCMHRTARLSLGWVEKGQLRCRYHGWAYGANGACLALPQLGGRPPAGQPRLPAFHCQERLGYVWLCKGEPLHPFPHIPEAEEPGFRLVHEFIETWQCSSLRVLENVFDMAHINYVHLGTFGVAGQDTPPKLDIEEFEGGFHMKAHFEVANPDHQKRNLGIPGERTTRTLDKTWYLPFGRRMRITYPNGVVQVIMNWAVPMDDDRTLMVQFALRNDTEADVPAEEVIAWDRKVTLEDKVVLETTEWDTPLEPVRERHMPADRPSLIMRRRLKALLEAHGESERTRIQSNFYEQGPVASVPTSPGSQAGMDSTASEVSPAGVDVEGLEGRPTRIAS